MLTLLKVLNDHSISLSSVWHYFLIQIETKQTTMKKTMIVLSLFIFTKSVHAQNLSFGPTGGIGHSWIGSPDNIDSRFHPYYNLGGKMVYSFVTNWGVSGDIKFSGEGYSVKQGTAYKYSARANYIRVPLQGVYFFGKYGDRVRPKISIGPSFGFLVGGKTKTTINGNETTGPKVKTFMNGFDFGFTVAGGGNVRIAPATWLNLDLAYYHGISDIIEGTEEAHNRNLGINLGVTFPLATVMPDKIKN
jgi:hypothetical protein